MIVRLDQCNERAGEGGVSLRGVTVMCVNTDCAVDGECDSCCGSFNFEDKEFSVKRGDYAPLMEKVSLYLQQAQVNPRLWKDCVHRLLFFSFITSTTDRYSPNPVTQQPG